ncbi:MAG: aspartate dehydrogenase [Archaeoglobaceae archaeon]
MKVGIIGCGSIGGFVAKWLSKADGFKLVSVFDIDREKALKLSEEMKINVAENIDEFLEKDMDVVVEAASQQAVFDYTEKVLMSGKDLIVLSVGAFADEEFYSKIKSLATKLGRKIFIPSGALAGVDAIKAVADYVEEVILVTRKSPSSFGMDKKGVIFEGNAREAARLFPRNLNVAATLGIAVGFDKVRVVAVAEDVDKNVHEIIARGRFGEIRIIVKNRKMEDNPKTSYLAALSVIKTLKNIKSSVVVG